MFTCDSPGCAHCRVAIPLARVVLTPHAHTDCERRYGRAESPSSKPSSRAAVDMLVRVLSTPGAPVVRSCSKSARHVKASLTRVVQTNTQPRTHARTAHTNEFPAALY